MAAAIRKPHHCLTGLWLRLFGSRTLPAGRQALPYWQAGIALPPA